MALLVFFVAFVLAAAVPAIGQEGFLSIDCGRDATSSGYTDAVGIFYFPDGPYVDSGENQQVLAKYVSRTLSRTSYTLRSFPTGGRNCYSLPTNSGAKYLVRLGFFYGNYDGKNSSSTLQFDLYLGVNYWDTMYAYLDNVYEAVFVAWASWAPVCFINTGAGTPFVSTVELRLLGTELYGNDIVTASQSMRMHMRRDMGPTNVYVTQYPHDPYDRFWWQINDPSWANLSTTSTIQTESKFKVPSTVLQKAIMPTGNNTVLSIMTWQDTTEREYAVFRHFADFQNREPRQFDVYFDVNLAKEAFRPSYLTASYVYTSSWFKATDGNYNITLAATNVSMLQPMLNALEIYSLITHHSTTTFFKDFDAIMAIKFEYGVKKNWMGDPCFPKEYAWDGVKCRNTSGNNARIVSLDLSNSNLRGVISDNFTSLTALENL
ncbi:hypothetical protein ABZP36_035641 [Zizania latifolia]